MGITEVVKVQGGIISPSEYAFRDDIEHVIIEGNLRIIGEHAFYNCKNLKSVEYMMKKETSLPRLINHFKFYRVFVGEDAFAGTALRTTMYESPPDSRRTHNPPWKLN